MATLIRQRNVPPTTFSVAIPEDSARRIKAQPPSKTSWYHCKSFAGKRCSCGAEAILVAVVVLLLLPLASFLFLVLFSTPDDGFILASQVFLGIRSEELIVDHTAHSLGTTSEPTESASNDLLELHLLLSAIQAQVPSGLAELSKVFVANGLSGSHAALSHTTSFATRDTLTRSSDLGAKSRALQPGFMRATGSLSPEVEVASPYDDIHFLMERHRLYSTGLSVNQSSLLRHRLYLRGSVFNRRFYYPVRRYERSRASQASSLAEVEAWHLAVSLSVGFGLSTSRLLASADEVLCSPRAANALLIEGPDSDHLDEVQMFFHPKRKDFFGGARPIHDRTTMFINMASYRDVECEPTLLDLVRKAKAPGRVFIGIAEQNSHSRDPPCMSAALHRPRLCHASSLDFDNTHPDSSREEATARRLLVSPSVDQLPSEPKLRDFVRGVCFFSENIRVRRIAFDHAYGPAFGRYMGMLLFRGESLAMVIDSHYRFTPMWDTLVTYMWSRYDDAKAFLTHYPEAYVDSEKPFKFFRSTTGYLCQAIFTDQYGYVSHRGIVVADTRTITTNRFNDPFVRLQSADMDQAENFRLPQPFIAGGFSFSSASIYRDVPFDPELNYVFDGEEVLLAMRLWTHGYNLYSPYRNVAYHMYGRPKAPKVWSDDASWYVKLRTATNRVKFFVRALHKGTTRLLVTGNTADKNVVTDVDRYGMGKQRTVEQWYAYSGVNRQNYTFDGRWCGTPKK